MAPDEGQGQAVLPQWCERINPEKSDCRNLQAFLGVDGAVAALQGTVCAEYYGGEERQILNNTHRHQMVASSLLLLTEAIAIRGGMEHPTHLNTTLQDSVAALRSWEPSWSSATISKDAYRGTFCGIVADVVSFADSRASDVTAQEKPQQWLNKSMEELSELCESITTRLKRFENRSEATIEDLASRNVDIRAALKTAAVSNGRDA
jgi:hypothetical protein